LSVDAGSDAEVIAAARDRPECFGVIFDRHASVVFRYLVRRVGIDEAETLLGETFRIAFERRESYDGARPNARPWLYGIATNLLARHRRSEGRRMRAVARLLAREHPEPDPSDTIAATLDADSMWPRIADAIDALPQGERDALVLFAWEELGYDDIAAALDIPVGTVRSRLNRARQTLRDLRTPIGREQ
jgi:RNA polymerase sigma factor (sigma-70 family)